MRVKEAFVWHRSFSADDKMDIPAGAPVEWSEKNRCYYVVPSFFQGEITRHDATHYGCRVEENNVEGRVSCTQS